MLQPLHTFSRKKKKTFRVSAAPLGQTKLGFHFKIVKPQKRSRETLLKEAGPEGKGKARQGRTEQRLAG